ncbi:MAG: hypothetical protein KIT84_29350 [Labilithrix sp.]|nr:hypothetical protein [Labilithrix sp.]MCW5815169.1 hypothetical protein [Labilithrix sp.]
MRRAFSFAAAFVTFGATSIASANGGGLAGYTGKQAGQTCNSCHSGGAAPTVTLNGPSTIAAGQTVDYTMVVTTGQSRAAGGVAATDGTTLTPGTGFRDSFGEMVQDGSRAVSGGSATFSFKVTAPATGTSLKLWAVGMAANGTGTGGDSSVQITKDVTVTGGAPPGSSTSSTSSSTSSSSSSSSSSGSDPATSSSSSSGASSKPTKTGSSEDEDEDEDDEEEEEDDGERRGSRPTTSVSSCAAGPRGPSDDLALAAGLGLAVAVVAAARRRATKGRA